MKKASRVLAILFAVLFVCTMLTSVLFLAFEADHDCSGEDCPVCAQIAACQNLLKTLFGAACGLLAVAVTRRLCTRFWSLQKNRSRFATPIHLKVKLLN